MKYIVSVVALIFVAVASRTMVHGSPLTMEIEPKSSECFYQELNAGSTFNMQFQVIRGGLLDVHLKITGPNNVPIVDKRTFFNNQDDKINEKEGKIQFRAVQNGVYAVCFDNSYSRWTSKFVEFEVELPGNKKSKDKEEVAKLEHLGPVVESVIKIADQLDAIETAQHKMRIREQQHRDSIESMNDRVKWLSLFETVVIIGLGVLQFSYVRTWFAETTRRGHV